MLFCKEKKCSFNCSQPVSLSNYFRNKPFLFFLFFFPPKLATFPLACIEDCWTSSGCEGAKGDADNAVGTPLARRFFFIGWLHCCPLANLKLQHIAQFFHQKPNHLPVFPFGCFWSNNTAWHFQVFVLNYVTTLWQGEFSELLLLRYPTGRKYKCPCKCHLL